VSGHSHGLMMPSLEFFRHIQQNRRLFHAFVSARSVELLAREFQGQLSKRIEQNLLSLSRGEVASSMPLSILARFITNTFLMLVQWWFENDFHYSPEQIDDVFQSLIMPAVQTALGLKR